MNARLASSSRNRRGVAILVVLVVISITFALSYAIMRSQGASLLIQHNAGLQASARQAAETGLQAAIQRMHTARWEGVDTTLSGSPGQHLSFEVAYAAGDASLSAADANYWEYPYRVTLLATGRAADPDNPARTVAHRIRAVVRLVPRKLADTPAGFSDLTNHILCQWTPGAWTMHVPSRIQGRVRVRAQLNLAQPEMPWSNEARWQFLYDLNQIRLSGGSDERPFSSTVKLYYAWQSWDTVALLNQGLGVATADTSTATEFVPPPLGDVAGYRLYPGGKQYSAQALPSDLRDTTRAPDPVANPLGVFVCYGRARLYDNVTIRGSLVTIGGADADVEIRGTNVRLEPPPANTIVPPAGSSLPVRLPALISADDVLFCPGSASHITGMVLAADDFEVQSDNQAAMQVDIRGRVAARDVLVRPRSDWLKTILWWTTEYANFRLQRDFGVKYFPEWLQKTHGLDPTPRIVISPEDTTVQYHWQDPAEPLYVPHPADVTALDPNSPGLRWELVEWTDSP